jgi:hypothetical protein
MVSMQHLAVGPGSLSYVSDHRAAHPRRHVACHFAHLRWDVNMKLFDSDISCYLVLNTAKNRSGNSKS